jgi:hypothetical protein
MDTRFWGPSGWRLLHMIATSSYANKSKTFWETLPYVLPCKFCRASLTGYYELLPIPDKSQEFPEWLYKIHNLVNQKLRDQGQSLPPDPPSEAVKERYDQLLEQGCSRTEFPGWNFLFSIADNHPSLSPSTPMPDSPTAKPKSLKERNRYNLLTSQERKKMLALFWKSIPAVLPFPEWQTSWKQHAQSVQKALKHRKSALSWLWTIRCGMESDLELIGKTTFYGLCKQVANHRSGCAKSTRAKTCRKISKAHKAHKGGTRKTRTRKQR